MTPPMTPREKVARVIAAELCRQDEDPEMTPEGVEFSPGDGLCWNYIDQGLFDFGQCADAILTAHASGADDHSGGVTNMVDHAELARLAEILMNEARGVAEMPRSEKRDEQAGYSALASVALTSLLAENAALRAKSDPSNWRDREDQWSKAVKEAHPVNSTDPDRHKHFDTAMSMVGNRHGKYELVGLVHWLLTRATEAERKLAEAVSVLREIAKGETPPEQHGHYLAHRQAVDAARAFLSEERQTREQGRGIWQ